MLSPELLLLGAAAGAFGLFLWVAVVGRDRPEAAFAAFADERGWDHRSSVPPEAAAWVEQVPAARRAGDHQGPYFAGPSAAGPFQALAIRNRPPRRDAAAWQADRTLVHIRTAAEAPHLRFGPAERFHVAEDTAASFVEHPGFRRRYDVVAEDEDFARAALDWETCAILTAPAKGVFADWSGHDLVVLFPLTPRTPQGFETLIQFASGLALRLQKPATDRLGPAHGAPAPSVSPDALPTGA